MASYEPLPDNDQESDYLLPHTKAAAKSAKRRQILSALALFFVALAFFKLGQWSVPEDPQSSIANSELGEKYEQDLKGNTTKGNTTKPMSDKYSVG